MTRKSQSILLLTAGMAWLGLSSHGAGHGVAGGGDASAAGCSCHGANNAATEIIQFSLYQNGGPGAPVTNGGQYVPGATYGVSLVLRNASGDTTLKHFGFQTTPRLANGNTAGSLLAVGPNPGTSVQTYIVNGRTGIEQSAPIPAVSAAPSFFQTSFGWTAPPVGSGPVTFFTAVCLTNNNGDTTGDRPNIGTVTLQEGPASNVQDVSKALPLLFSPNPATDCFWVDTRTWKSGTYHIAVISSQGQIVYEEIISHRGTDRTEVRLPSLSKGLYGVRVRGDGFAQVAPLFIR